MVDSAQIIKSLEARLRVLEDKDELTALLNRYCNIADAKDWDGYANTFAEDGVMTFEGWGDTVGRAAISKAASAEQIFDGLQHSMTNMQFEVDGDKATGTSYLWFAATPDTKEPEMNYAFGGPYKFEFQRAERGWEITRMRLKKIWAQGKDTKKVFGAT
jgi:uncharacterized protein (TIGR02246 family)